jgi:hypothetical protein
MALSHALFLLVGGAAIFGVTPLCSAWSRYRRRCTAVFGVKPLFSA